MRVRTHKMALRIAKFVGFQRYRTRSRSKRYCPSQLLKALLHRNKLLLSNSSHHEGQEHQGLCGMSVDSLALLLDYLSEGNDWNSLPSCYGILRLCLQ